MRLCGEAVNHRAFGNGRIVEFYNDYVTVLFDKIQEKKKFQYPAAFDLYLELENKFLMEEIEKERNNIALNEAENIKLKEIVKFQKVEDKINSIKKRAVKANNMSNIAFKCNYCDGGKSKNSLGFKGVCSNETIKYNINVAKHIWCSGEDSDCNRYMNGEISRIEVDDIFNEYGSVCYESNMLNEWHAYGGITQNGKNKGKPMTLRNVCSNSLALLTTRLPYDEEINRFIFAIFLVDENYEGDYLDAGYVGANSKYRIQLSLNEAKKVKFWDYYYNRNKPETIKFGSGLHRYLTDIQAAQVINKICEIKKSSLEDKFSNEFLEHYCKIKELNIDTIPAINGGLKRI